MAIRPSLLSSSSRPATPFSTKDSDSDYNFSCEAKTWERLIDTNVEFSKLTASSSGRWLTAKLDNTNNGPVTLKLDMEENNELDRRQATVTVRSYGSSVNSEFYVTQEGKPGIKFSVLAGNDQDITAVAKEFVWTMQSNIAYSDLKVMSNESWCQVTLADSNEDSYVKSYKLTTSVAENPTDKERQAVVTISSERYNVSHSYMITQAAATFTMGHAALGFDRDGGNRTVTITSNASWQAECTADWVTLERQNGYLTVRVAPTAEDRTATVTFKDKDNTAIIVNQTKYKVGEEYNENGISGTVAYIGDDKRFIYRFVSDKERWCTTSHLRYFGATDLNDGEYNCMKLHEAEMLYGSNFPALNAVEALNANGVTGWFLPAINEMDLFKQFITKEAWSSTENGYDAAYVHNGINKSNKNDNIACGVYAIRKF